MDPDGMAIALAVVAGQAVLLYLLSRRLIMGLVVRTLAARSRGRVGRLVLLLLRLPGNLLHEWSHAAAYLVSGYTISRIGSCLSDPEGRGYCTPGRPWSPVHWRPLAAGVASVLPLFVGALAIRSLASWLDVSLPAADLVRDDLGPVIDRLVSDLGGFVRGLDWRAWETYAFWYLALSIGAELAPSEVDLRRGAPILLVLCVGLVLFAYALPQMEARRDTELAIYRGLWWLVRTLSAALFAGLVGCGLVGSVAALVALALGGGEEEG
jgi:hypothetical protein